MKIKALLILFIFLPLIGCDRYTKEKAIVSSKAKSLLRFSTESSLLLITKIPEAC